MTTQTVTTAKPDISPAEWEVMRLVWTLGHATSHLLIESLQEKMDWQESTVKTLIRRLTKKGYLKREGRKRPYQFVATISEEMGINTQVDQLFNSLCAMQVGPTLQHLVATQPISQGDLEKLQTLIDEKKQTAPTKVACNCLKNCHIKESSKECAHDGE